MTAADLTHPHFTTRDAFERALNHLSDIELHTVLAAMANLAYASVAYNDLDFGAECSARHDLVDDEIERRMARHRR